MGDIDELNTDINQALNGLEGRIESINKKEYSQRPKLIKRCENEVAEIATRVESYELEILYLDKARAGPYKESLRTIQERLNKIKETLEFKKKERETEGTLIGELMKRRAQDEESTGAELIQIGDHLQQKGTESLMRTLEKVNASNQIADEITLELHKQLEQLENTSKVVKDTRSEVKKANEYIKYFAKELYTDKFIMCLVTLCILACIGIIILKVKNGGLSTSTSTTSSTDSTTSGDQSGSSGSSGSGSSSSSSSSDSGSTTHTGGTSHTDTGPEPIKK